MNDDVAIVPCSCGRSPTEQCVGWHSLPYDEFQRRQRMWLEEELKRDQELEEYKRQAQELWSDSCTTPRSKS